MANRYTGDLVINVQYHDTLKECQGRGGYRCSVRKAGVKGGATYRCAVGEPRILTVAVDSPEAYDAAARACLSFMDDDRDNGNEAAADLEIWQSLDSKGCNRHVGRSVASRWPEGHVR